VTAARASRAAAVIRPGRSRRGGLATLLLALGGLIALRLGLMLPGTLDLPPAPPPGAHAPEVMAPEWLPEPAAGPEDASPELPGPLPAGAGASAAPWALDPADLTASEIAVLHQLAARRAALDGRERAIDQRAALIERAAADLEQQIARLSALHAEIAAAVGAHDAVEEARLASLIKIYETMKPKAAAEIFDRLEMPVLIEVVERMREVKSADVLARMNPVKAKQVTSELARRSELLEAGRAAAGGVPERPEGG
jgi:flagellar motility protein MotE (MotC chaperone)